ncbi:ABC transporter substrate-binding protein [Pigmentibacter ruber]|uniref:ABC transporter substrate-binding protein n=1 Tax=Pigmentibacter ruber TaxID=2683196 RepID=UPI00192E75A2|nr:ABC transporter substrate-binding protein [Pigmentibacter ruber]BFD32173.1 ABC transporter substrate-binding protein [Pigmentibacter ruber]
MKLMSRKFFISIISLIPLLYVTNVQADVNEIKKKKTLIVGVKDSLYPFGFVNEKSRTLEGYDIDFAKEIADKLGVKIELKPVTSANRIPLLMEDNVDLLACTMTITPERAKQINFSYPYFVSKQKFIVKKGTVKSLKDLENKKIGTTKGSTSELNAAKAIPSAKILSFDDYPQAFLALQQGKVFAITTDESILAGILSKASKKEDFELPAFDISKEPYGIGVNKKNPELLKIVNQTLIEMEKNGKADATFAKWFGPNSSVPLVKDFKITP